jgi:hypothetical protein
LACLSQFISTGYPYARDVVTSQKCQTRRSVKLYATTAASIVDAINDTTSEVLNKVIPTIEMPYEMLNH